MVKDEIASVKLPPKDVSALIEIDLVKKLTVLQNIKIVDAATGFNGPVGRLPARLSAAKLSSPPKLSRVLFV